MRARDIKPGFFKNDLLAECSPFARLLFIGLWMLADREGRLECRPKKIRAEILPYDSVDIDTLLRELEEGGFIVTYYAEGMKILWIPKFLKHQRPHQNETPSVLPPYEGPSTSSQGSEPASPTTEGLATMVTSPCYLGEKGLLPRNEALRSSSLSPSSLSPSSLTPSSQSPSTQSPSTLTPSPDIPPTPPSGGGDAEEEIPHEDFELAPPQKKPRAKRTDYRWGDFEALWARYPRHDAEERAKKAWAKLVKAGEAPEQKTLMAAVSWKISYWNDRGTPTDLIPYLANWLAEKRWNDPQPTAHRERGWQSHGTFGPTYYRPSKEEIAMQRTAQNAMDYLREEEERERREHEGGNR